MRNKLFLGAIVALLLAVASVPLAFAGGGSGSDDDDVRIFQLTLRHGPFTELDHGASGPGVGDRFIFFGDVFRNGEQVGAGGGECVNLLFRPGPDPAGEPEALTDQCVATVSLPQGQITAQGLADRTAPGPLTLPITGGTGAYRTAHGELETEGPDEAGDERITVKLILGDDD
jgi:hypothetical protein